LVATVFDRLRVDLRNVKAARFFRVFLPRASQGARNQRLFLFIPPWFAGAVAGQKKTQKKCAPLLPLGLCAPARAVVVMCV
jgi:hypothetical protein